MSAVFDCWFPVSTAMKPFYVIQSRIQDRTLKRNINDNNQVNGEVGKKGLLFLNVLLAPAILLVANYFISYRFRRTVAPIRQS